MYSSLNSPSQLTGWSSSGGDPCGQSWKGIKCLGSKITEIRLSGLGLTGSMGYQLSSLTSVTYFDLSNNNLQGDIPYQLPPNALYINLAQNSFKGTVPYSISQMIDLQYLNLGHNQLNGQLSDMFGQLPRLKTLDLSFNSLSGDLPQSFGSLSSLSLLNLQNNQFTGPINALASLPLDDLNVQNNRFTGWVPNELKSIKNLKTGGNSWSSGHAPPPPNMPHSSSSSSSGQENKSHASSHSSKGGKGNANSGLSVPAIAGIAVAVLVAVGILIALLIRKSSSHYLDEEKLSMGRTFTPLVSHEFKDLKSVESSASINVRTLQTSPSMGLKPPPSDRLKSFNDNDFANKIAVKRCTSIRTTSYSLTDLKLATGSFAADRLVGEGSLGCVYRAKYTDGKVLAVKKLNLSSLQKATSEDFTEAVASISKLHHPNITELVGYCSENGHHLLVYEFFRNGSLHQFLHMSDDYSNPLTWNTRIKIALGTARALEHLHEICIPSAIHKNIKSANILLDTELDPHLTDCGLAAFHQHTSQNSGGGYTAPECTGPAAYTLKSDVYSFGVVMLELLTGRKPFDSIKPRAEQSLVRWATPQLHDIDALTKMVDPALRGLYPAKSLSRFADVIALCVQSEPEFRPPMSEVVQALVRLVQGNNLIRRTAGDELGSSCRTDDMEADYPYL